MEDMLYLEKLGELYGSLNPSERHGIRVGLVPNRVMDTMRENRIPVADLMEYDELVRKALW